MPVHCARLFRGKPLLAGIVVIADEFFLLGIDRNHRPALPQASFHGGIDVPELRIAVRMVLSLLGLAVALQTVVQIVKDLRHFGMADRMLAPGQGLGDRPRALARPSQRRFRIASRLLIDHRFQPVHQLRIGHGNGLAAASGTADATFQPQPVFDFLNSLGSPCATSRTRGAPDSRPRSLKPWPHWPP